MMRLSGLRPYGAEGPLSQTAGHDGNYLALAGVLHRNGNEAPVYFSEKYGFWALSRWDDVAAAHKDYGAFSSSYGTDLHLLSIFSPALKGDEQHDEEGALPPSGPTPPGIVVG